MCRYEHSVKRKGTQKSQAKPNLKKTISTYTLRKKEIFTTKFSLFFKATTVQVTLTSLP